MSSYSGLKSDDDGSVIFVPYVKPKPPVIVLDDSDDDYANPQDSSSSKHPQKISLPAAFGPAERGVINRKSNELVVSPLNSSVFTVEPNASERQRPTKEKSAREDDTTKSECNETPQKRRKGLFEPVVAAPSDSADSATDETMTVAEDCDSKTKLGLCWDQKYGSNVTLPETTGQKVEKWKELLAERRRAQERFAAAAAMFEAKQGNSGEQPKLSRKQRKKERVKARAKKKRQEKLRRQYDRRVRLKERREQESVEYAAVLSNFAYDTALTEMGIPKHENLEEQPSNKKVKLADYRANMKLLNKIRRKNKERKAFQSERREQESVNVIASVPEKPESNIATCDTAEVVPGDENLETQQSHKKLKLAEYRANMNLLKKIRRENYQNRINIERLEQKMAEASASETEPLADSEGSPPLALVVNRHSDAGNDSDPNTGLEQVPIFQDASHRTEDSTVAFNSTSALETLEGHAENISKSTDAPRSSWNWLDGNGNPVTLHDIDQRSDFPQAGNLWPIAIPLHLPPPGYPDHRVQNWFITSNTGVVNPVNMNPFANTFVQQSLPYPMITHQQQSYVSIPTPQQVVQTGMIPGQPKSIFAVENNDANEVQNAESLYTRRPRKPTP